MTVLEFKRPDPPKSPPQAPLAYVTIYPNATYFTDPNHDEPDHRAMGDVLFDSTFHVHAELDECKLLVMFGSGRTDSIRAPGAFDTPAQRAWLRRRLDTLYAQVTGEPVGILARFAKLLRRTFTATGDDP